MRIYLLLALNVFFLHGTDDIRPSKRARCRSRAAWARQGAMRGERSVTVFASDLPGHVTQASASKKLPG